MLRQERVLVGVPEETQGRGFQEGTSLSRGGITTGLGNANPLGPEQKWEVRRGNTE